MKLFIFLLLIALLMQTSFLPLNIVLILLICRAFIYNDKIDFYLSFATGILLSILTATTIGFWPITFLCVVMLAHLARLLPVTSNILTVLPITFLLVLTVNYFEQIFLKVSFDINKVVLLTFLIVPIYLFLKFWEERFVVSRDIKLKFRN